MGTEEAESEVRPLQAEERGGLLHYWTLEEERRVLRMDPLSEQPSQILTLTLGL